MTQEKPTPWSRTLKAQTLAALHDLPPTPDGLLRMKHKQRGYGHFNLTDLLAGCLHLHADGEPSPIMFDTPAAVIAAGWAVD